MLSVQIGMKQSEKEGLTMSQKTGYRTMSHAISCDVLRYPFFSDIVNCCKLNIDEIEINAKQSINIFRIY